MVAAAAAAAVVVVVVAVIHSPLPFVVVDAVAAVVATDVMGSRHHSQTGRKKFPHTFHSVICAKD